MHPAEAVVAALIHLPAPNDLAQRPSLGVGQRSIRNEVRQIRWDVRLGMVARGRLDATILVKGGLLLPGAVDAVTPPVALSATRHEIGDAVAALAIPMATLPGAHHVAIVVHPAKARGCALAVLGTVHGAALRCAVGLAQLGAARGKDFEVEHRFPVGRELGRELGGALGRALDGSRFGIAVRSALPHHDAPRQIHPPSMNHAIVTGNAILC